jgi:hypothetical protein
MDREIMTWLYDVYCAIDEIEQFLPKGERVFETYSEIV